MLLRAKSKQSLFSHLKDTLAIMEYWIEKNPVLLQTVSERMNGKIECDVFDLTRYLRLAAYSHDFGKAALLWQERLDEGGTKHNLSHPLISGQILSFILKDEKDEILKTTLILAVIAHHSMLHDGSYRKYENNHKTIQLGDELTRIVKYIYDADVPTTVKINDGWTLVRDIKLNFKDKWEYVKYLYSFMLRLVMMADQCTSEIENTISRPSITDQAVCFSNPKVMEIIHKWIPDASSAFKSVEQSDHGKWWTTPREVQKRIREEHDSFMIVHDFCGGGKTGAALSWARKLFEQGQADRLIFTLPTRFTTNSMYQSLSEKHGIDKNAIGIYHGEARQFLIKNESKEEEWAVDYKHWIDDELRFSTYYHHTITVSTIDHLLYSLLHCYKNSDRTFGYLTTSCIVFDELHYYDGYTMERIGQCLKLLRKLNIPHLIMSATMPDKFLKSLNHTGRKPKEYYKLVQGSSSYQKNNQTKEKIPVKIEKMDEPLIDENFQISDWFIQLIRQHRSFKQLVIVNQVERAKQLYRFLKQANVDVNIICYHSELILKERNEIEQAIHEAFEKDNQKPCIVISTQLCEMSIDISADVLYSEIAPLDALGQRLGRQHRNGLEYKKEDCSCNICNREYIPREYEYKAYIFPFEFADDDRKFMLLPYDTKDEAGNYTNILESSFQLLPEFYSFSSFNDAINKLYDDTNFKLENIQMRVFMKTDAIFGKTPFERFGDEQQENGQNGFSVRLFDQNTYEVIPIYYYEEVKSKILEMDMNEVSIEIILYKVSELIKDRQVKMGIRKYHSYKSKREKEGYYDEKVMCSKEFSELFDQIDNSSLHYQLNTRYKDVFLRVTFIPYEPSVGFDYENLKLVTEKNCFDELGGFDD